MRAFAVILFMAGAATGWICPALIGQTPARSQMVYRGVTNWASIPEGRVWGQTSGVDVGAAGAVWVIDRCGSTSCAGRLEAPLMKFDASGNLLQSYGAGMFVFPHGTAVDREGNIWVTDGQARDGRGDQVFKFSSDGRLVMTLGTPGVAEGSTNTFQPEDVVVGADGDIFIADGAGERILKFSADGKFIKTWGHKGSGTGEFSTPHSLAFDSQGRLFVCDRGNNRIQIFDQQGRFLDAWKQFGRPSGIAIDRNDVVYVTDSDSNSERNPGGKRGITIGSARNGSVITFISDVEEEHPGSAAAEGVAVDSSGNIYTAGPKGIKKYVLTLNAKMR